MLIQTCLLIALLAMSFGVPATPADDQYQQALHLTRQGHYTKAIREFEHLVSQNPDHLNYRYDYLLALGWSGNDHVVLQESRQLDPNQTPPYVLEVIGKSARNVNDYRLAQKMYRLALRKQPNRLQSQLGLAYVLIESGDTEEPATMLLSLSERNPRHVEVLEALAITHQSNNEYFKSLSLYQKILKLQPQHRGAKRGLVRLATLMGAPHLAMSIIEKNPGLIDDKELNRIRQDRAAIGMRWGHLYTHRQAVRYGDTDAALDELQKLLDQLNEQSEQDSVRSHQLKTDMLVGLYDRKQSKKCIALFEELKNENADIADYGLMAAAGAYQSEGQAENARDLYLEILHNNPDDFEARVGLFYAYSDIPEAEQALVLANELASSEVEWIGGKDSPKRKKNPNKITVDEMQALAFAWADNLSLSQQRFDQMVNEAPYNAGLRADRGYTYLWRGWPKRALQEFQLAQDIEREAITPAVGKVEAFLERRDYLRAESALQKLVDDFPDEVRVAKQQRKWHVHNMREFYLELSGSDSTAGQPGSRTLELDAWQYTSPMNKNYRVFAHEVGEHGKFTEGSEAYWRVGGGVEYRSPNWEMLGEITTGVGDYSEIGIGIAATWTPDDIWATTLAMNSYSNDIPLRGRLNEGVEGADIKIDVNYRFHESRKVQVGAQYIDMSDGNERTSAHADISQRLKSSPGYNLEGNLGFYGSNNSRVNAPYFNPKSDSSAAVTLTNEWLIERKKKREFLHRMSLSAGVYNQDGYGSDGLWSVSYQHEWIIGDALVLNYGIAHSRHPYDGIQDNENRVSLMVDWRF